MKRMIRITGLAIATLAISTAAMAQQGGGGGSGGGGGGGEGGGGDTSVIELRLQDHESARQARILAERRAGRSCITHACNEQQRPPVRRASDTAPSQSCAGGEMWVVRERAGGIVRIVCERW